MTQPNELEGLLEEAVRVSEEILRLKDAQRSQLLTHPESDLDSLDSAIQYWRQRKTEVEGKLRLLR